MGEDEGAAQFPWRPERGELNRLRKMAKLERRSMNAVLSQAFREYVSRRMKGEIVHPSGNRGDGRRAALPKGRTRTWANGQWKGRGWWRAWSYSMARPGSARQRSGVP